jgi:hypothetical protein
MRIDSSGRLNLGTTTSISGSLLNIDGGFINANVTDSSHKFIRSTTATTGLGDPMICRVNTSADMADGFASVITFQVSDSGVSNSSLGFIGATRSGADNSGSLIFHTYNNGSQSEKVRITSAGNVGIGTTSPGVKLEIKGADGDADAQAIRLMENTTQGGFIKYDGNTNELQLGGYNSGENTGIKIARNDATTMFNTGGSERMRIDSSGNVLISKTVNDLGTAGLVLGDLGHVQSTISNSNVIYANRLSTDGDVYRIYQDGSQEGSISVSGSTVSYNGFTGTHWSRFTDNSKPTILRGTVLETLDEMCDWYNLEFDVVTQDEDGNDITSSQKIPHVLTDTQSNGDVITYNHEGTDYQATIVKETDIKHMKSKVSNTTDAKNVYGVFVAYDEDGEGYNDFWVAAVGSFVVRIKANETIAKGDLLQSNGDGTAKVQTDDAVRSSSFAKVLSTTIIETYEDGSYLVPCSLMC